MNISEIIGDAVRYPLSDPKKLLIFGIFFVVATLYSNFTTTSAANLPLIFILSVLALIAIVFIFGYELRILRATLAGLIEIPEFDDLNDMFFDGLKVVVVGIVYTILLTVIFGILFLLFGLLAGLTGLLGIFIVLIVIMALFIYPLLLMSLTNMVYNDTEINAALKFSEIFNKISNIGWGNFLLWYLVTGIIYLILAAIGVLIIGAFSLIHLKIVGGILYPLIIGSFMSMFIYRSVALFYMSGNYETGDLGYLECDNCKGYYELQNGESPEDFSECECGGKLVYRR
jgi:Protein of unknown function (DUF4013)